MDIDKLLTISFRIILIIILLIAGYQLNNLLNKSTSQNIYFDLSKYNITEKHQGFYAYDGFFCVVTKNWSNQEIIETTIHELAHLLIETDDEHFMGKYNEKHNKSN